MYLKLIGQELKPASVLHASDIQNNTPIYDMSLLRTTLDDKVMCQQLMTEWAQVLINGSGVLVLRAVYADTGVLDEATAVYEAIIANEKLANGSSRDHFAASGFNDRIWNSLQKLCEEAPDVFLRYFTNTSIAAVCEARLGPNYQMTAQINLMHPSGTAQ